LICVEVLECDNKETDEVPAKLLESSLRLALSEEDLKHDVTPPIHCDEPNGNVARKLSIPNGINPSPSLKMTGGNFFFFQF